MTTVDDAVEAGARALFDEERNESMGDVPWPEYDSDNNLGRPIWEEHARAVLRTAWPLLSDGLRELHPAQWECGNPRHTNPEAGCPECSEVCATCDRTMPCPTRP